MTGRNKKKTTPVTKPFQTGAPLDGKIWKDALRYFGMMLLIWFMCFIVSSMLNFGYAPLRILLNIVVIGLTLVIAYSRGSARGADAVAYGEIVYQRLEKGGEVPPAERAEAFHPLKGFVTALLGSLPILIVAVIFAFITEKQVTSIGVLPDWMKTYQRRAEIGDALVAYTRTAGLSLQDILRIVVRTVLMPFVVINGVENKAGMLLLERLSPVLVLLPAVSYGIGYITGKNIRTRIHTEISENNRKRLRREKKARERRASNRRKPEQLN